MRHSFVPIAASLLSLCVSAAPQSASTAAAGQSSTTGDPASVQSNSGVVRVIERQTQMSMRQNAVPDKPTDFSLSQASSVDLHIASVTSLDTATAPDDNESVVTGVQRQTQVRQNKALVGQGAEPVVRGIVRLNGNRKTTAPVTIDGLQPGPMVAPGKQVIIVTITPLVSAPIEVHATGSDGVAVEGQQGWRFDGKQGIPVTHSITLENVGPFQGERRLFFSATVDPDATAQTGIASFLLNPSGLRSKSTADLGKSEIGGKGQAVVELKAQ